MPRSASTTKPVAWPVRFHSVSKARGASTRMETMEGETRAMVAAQACSVPAASACEAAKSRNGRRASSGRFMGYPYAWDEDLEQLWSGKFAAKSGLVAGLELGAGEAVVLGT